MAEWWIGEVANDPSYAEEIIPLLVELLGDLPGTVLDLGCGEGQGMAAVSAPVIGCDLSLPLAERAAAHGATVVARLPDLRWLKTGAVDGAYCVLVLEHLPTLDGFFEEVNRVVRDEGSLVVISNHPAYTAPGAGPIIDQSDGEVLWRWGPYFTAASDEAPAGDQKVTFHHRPLGSVLNAAAGAGWSLEQLEERGLGPDSVARHPGMAGQEHMPRLLGIRWGKTPAATV